MENSTETNLKIMGLSRKSQNGEVIDNRGFDLEYDGNYADINSFVNNQNKHVRLDNEELLELFNKPMSNKSLEDRLMSDFKTSSSKMLGLMNTPLPLSIRKLSSSKLKSSKSKTKSKSSKSKTAKSKSKPKTLFGDYSYPLLNRFKVPKIDMDNLIPYGLMNTKLKSKLSSSKLSKTKSKSIKKSTTQTRKKSKSISKSKSRSKSKSKSKSKSRSKSRSNSVKFITNGSNSLRDLLSPLKSPSTASRQIIRRATPYVRNTASKLSSFIPQSRPSQPISMKQSASPYSYQSFSSPSPIKSLTQQSFSPQQELYQYPPERKY